MRQRKPTSLAAIKLIIGSIEVFTVMRLKITMMLTMKVFTAGDSIAVITVLREKNTTNSTMNTPIRGTMTGRVTGVGGTSSLNGLRTQMADCQSYDSPPLNRRPLARRLADWL